MRRFFRWGSVTLALFVVVILAGCSGQTTMTPQPLTVDTVSSLDCADAQSVQAAVDEANRAPSDSGKHRTLATWIPDDRTVTDVQAQLDAQVTKACAASAAPSVSATPTATESATPQQGSGSPSPTMVPANYIGWDQIVASPPAGLQAAIDAHTPALGWGWTNVQQWAKVRVDGKAPSTRIALVVEGGADPRSADDKATGVPIVRVKTCTIVSDNSGCPTAERGVIVLAPLNDQGTALLPGSGVALISDFPLVSYTS